MTRFTVVAVAVAAAVTVVNQAEGHILQTFPISRQYSYGPVFKEWDDPMIDYCPHCYNARGPKYVRERAMKLTDEDVLAKYGNGEFPLLYSPMADNGNYLEPQGISVRHGVCGDPEQNAEEGTNVYSTPNSNWEVLDSFTGGQVIEIDTIMNAYHWGHCEFSICNAADLADSAGVATQECFNMHPLTRDPDDGGASPIDPNYPGRYYVDPVCRGKETEQSKPDEAPDGYNIKMRYVLPNIDCEHCILQMVYYTGNSCKHIGYDEFNPPSWPGSCANDKSDWIELNRSICGENSAYPEEFWACSDISITSDGSTTPSNTPSPASPTSMQPSGDDATPPPSATSTSAATDSSMTTNTSPPTSSKPAEDTPSPSDEETTSSMPSYTSSPDSSTDMQPSDNYPVSTPSPSDEETTSSMPSYTSSPDSSTDMQPSDDYPVPTPSPSAEGTTAGTDSSAPTELPIDGDYEHLGCFMDSKSDRVLGNKLISPLMTPELCFKHCDQRDAAYMATQFGRECWCSHKGGLDYERHGTGICDKWCDGNKDEVCGGADAFDLYKLDWPEPSTDPEYLECYADNRNDRVMGHMMSTDDMSPAVCREHCATTGAMYYGTQYGRECWCGTSDRFEDYERHGLGGCHMACSGDDTIACGGHDAFSLFRFMDMDEPTDGPAPTPSAQPVDMPSEQPASTPSAQPIDMPSEQPVDMPSEQPSPMPTTAEPTDNVECTGTPVEAWEQCGGDDWTGSTCCPEGYECTVMGMGTCYSQCRLAGDMPSGGYRL